MYVARPPVSPGSQSILRDRLYWRARYPPLTVHGQMRYPSLQEAKPTGSIWRRRRFDTMQARCVTNYSHSDEMTSLEMCSGTQNCSLPNRVVATTCSFTCSASSTIQPSAPVRPYLHFGSGRSGAFAQTGHKQARVFGGPCMVWETGAEAGPQPRCLGWRNMMSLWVSRQPHGWRTVAGVSSHTAPLHADDLRGCCRVAGYH